MDTQTSGKCIYNSSKLGQLAETCTYNSPDTSSHQQRLLQEIIFKPEEIAQPLLQDSYASNSPMFKF